MHVTGTMIFFIGAHTTNFFCQTSEVVTGYDDGRKENAEGRKGKCRRISYSTAYMILAYIHLSFIEYKSILFTVRLPRPSY